jgi:hypothetical protein
MAIQDKLLELLAPEVAVVAEVLVLLLAPMAVVEL